MLFWRELNFDNTRITRRLPLENSRPTCLPLKSTDAIRAKTPSIRITEAENRLHNSKLPEMLKKFNAPTPDPAHDRSNHGDSRRCEQADEERADYSFGQTYKDEDEFQCVFPTSPQLLKEGLCCPERRPLFRR